MRLFLPERVPLFYVFGFGLVLFAVQQVEGTDVVFSFFSFVFIMAAGLAFNTAKGLSTPSGAYITGYSMLAVILGITYKAILGEPGGSNLLVPNRTMEVFAAGMCAMWGTSALSRKILQGSRSPVRNLEMQPRQMHLAALGGALFGMACVLYSILFTVSRVGITRSIVNVAGIVVIPASLVFSIVAEIRRSNGRRTTNLTVWVLLVFAFLIGAYGFSKQGMFTPLFVWLIAVASQRIRISWYQVVLCGVGIWVLLTYMVPYSQYGRQFNSVDLTFQQHVEISFVLLTHLETVREDYTFVTSQKFSEEEIGHLYYDHPTGIMDRLNMIVPDDALVNVTEKGHVYGMHPVLGYFLNGIPHILWKNKPVNRYDQDYAHETGFLAEDDNTTGIAFTPTGEAFHLAKWVGIFLLAPFCWILLFTLYDWFFPDVRENPWGLFLSIQFFHGAPEGTLAAPIGAIVPEVFLLLASMWIFRYILPYLGIAAGGLVGSRWASAGSTPVVVPEPQPAPAGMPAVRRWSDPIV